MKPEMHPMVPAQIWRISRGEVRIGYLLGMRLNRTLVATEPDRGGETDCGKHQSEPQTRAAQESAGRVV